MPGAIAPNLHEGSRSEYLAQYVFAAWGTVVPVPHQEDSGLDLYCNLVERVGQRAWAKSPYTVQVKSNMKPWVFDKPESVRWLIEHPLPLFLCVVDKSEARVRVYQTTPRFYIWSRARLPARLLLTPTTEMKGVPPKWSDGENFSLSAPILDFTLQQYLDEGFLSKAKSVIESWVGVDHANLAQIRNGIRKFVVPSQYTPNEVPDIRSSTVFLKTTHPVSEEELEEALPPLRESLEFVGGELFKRNDLRGAALSLLLHRHLFAGKLHPFLGEIDERLALEEGSLGHIGIERLERVVDEAIAKKGKLPPQVAD